MLFNIFFFNLFLSHVFDLRKSKVFCLSFIAFLSSVIYMVLVRALIKSADVDLKPWIEFLKIAVSSEINFFIVFFIYIFTPDFGGI